MIKKARIVVLDVRPYLRKKLEPFKLIMDAVSSLEPKDILVLHATFKPTPLFGVMKVKGYTHKVEEIDEQYWIVAFARDVGAKEQLDVLQLRELAIWEEEERPDEYKSGRT
ncbi:DUF2249 domain-containing protein [Paenibacillus sp. SYP-B3998]|uniref:DUF2249 domain-containing protein n=1 Tax=Paenibacillus sp. SYP-B3998 TaxID=2678564 RepID=UPI001F0739D3|nr:DUF2249 domain-containing protein [Paenibacillus sp. SYP-B3998]